jgi:hypothetical protein
MLERRPRPGGKDVVEHPRGGHDDYINALALAATYATLKKPALTVTSIAPQSEPGMPDWQLPYFGLRPRRTAPTRSVPSDALLESREQRARRDAADGAWSREMADAIRKQREEEKFDQLKAAVHKFGSEAVEHLTRRSDPEFRLPPELRNIAPSKDDAKRE